MSYRSRFTNVLRAATLVIVIGAAGCVPGANTVDVRSGASAVAVATAEPTPGARAARARLARTRDSYSRTEFEIPANPVDDRVFEYR